MNAHLNDPNVYFELGNDIDASETSGWNAGAGFFPIGSDVNAFTGHFDGKGHKIMDLFINRPDPNTACPRVGLIGWLRGEVKNVSVVNVDITGPYATGGLVGSNGGGTITNCFSRGNVTASYGYYVGGLVGYNNNGSIATSYSAGYVTGIGCVGGLVGLSFWNATITNCYSEADANGIHWVGGLVGANDSGSTINNCYSVGNVCPPEGLVGGLASCDPPCGDFYNCFWDVETSGQTTSAGGTGKTTAEMKQQATFSGWDFETIWDIVEGQTYPFLRGNSWLSACDSIADAYNLGILDDIRTIHDFVGTFDPCDYYSFTLIGSVSDFIATLDGLGSSTFDARDLQNLSVGEAIARIERADYDFNLKTSVPPDISPEVAQKRRERLIALSRQKYAHPQEKVQVELEKYKAVIEPKKPAVEIKKEKAELKQPVSSEKLAKKVTPERAELLPEEKSFLVFISQHAGMFVTKIYKALGLSGYKGDRLKSSLIDKDLIVQQETRKGLRRRLAKVLTLTDKGANIVKKLPLRGKGGDLHRQLQDTIAEQAEVFGWKATIEKRIPRSLDSVDVELRRDDIRVAIEISSTTKAEHEIQNIKKCLEAGYDYILAVCSDDKRLSLLKTEVKKSFSFKERERIRFYAPSRIKEFFHSISPVIVSENGIVSGQITKQKEILNSEEAADFLGISINTLYEWVSQKRIPHMKVGGLLKFKRGHLEKWLDKKVQKEEEFDILDE